MKKYGMMYQVQCGDAVTKVSDIAAALPACPDLFHAPFANAHERDQAEDRAGRRGERAALRQVAAWQPGFLRQAVDLGVVDEQIEGVQAAQRAVRIIAIELGAFLSLSLELHQTFLRANAQLRDGAELDRIGGTRLGASGLEPHLHAVVA